MNLKLEFDVTVTQHESGMCLAACAEFPRKVGIGDTPDDAAAHLRALVLRPVLQPIRPPAVGVNPWVSLAEAFRGTPLDEWKQELAERRRLSAEVEREAS